MTRAATRRAAYLALAAALGLQVSCSSDDGSKATSRASSEGDRAPGTISATPGPTDSAGVAKEWSLSGAEPLSESLYETVERIAQAAPGLSRRVVAVGGTGTTLLVEGPPARGEHLSADWRLLIREPGAEDVVVPRVLRGSPGQVLGAAVSAKWVVWMETTSTTLDAQPWTLHAYDRRTKQSALLATSPNMTDGRPGPPVPGYTAPVLIGEIVYWAQVTGKRGAENVEVRGCSLATCEPATVAKGAAFPASDGKNLYVLTAPRYVGQREQPGPYTVQQVAGGELQKIKKLTITDNQVPAGMGAASDRVVVTIGGEASHAYLIDPTTSASTYVEAPHDGLFGPPVVTDTYVAIAEASGSSPLNLGGFIIYGRDNRIATIGNTSGLYAIYGQGSILAWQEDSSNGTDPTQMATRVVRFK